MSKNNKVDTAHKGQTATIIDKKTTGEEKYRNFRINALRRRCKRYGMNEEQIEGLVKKLVEQLDSPKQYRILVMYNRNDAKLFEEALKNAEITYLFHADEYIYVDGNQTILNKIREIAPSSAKIYPYVKKMESVIPEQVKIKEKKPTNNTKAKKVAAKAARKAIKMMHDAGRKKGKGKAAAKIKRHKINLELKKARKAKIAQIVSKTSQNGSKIARKTA